MKKIKILIVGPQSPPISGPSVKNTMLSEWLNNNNKDYIFKLFNTNSFRKNQMYEVFFGIIRFILIKRIILSVSKNGRLIFIPICYFLGKKVVLFPAGGSFDSEINELGRFKSIFLHFCKCLKSTYSQTIQLKKGLEFLEFKNVIYFPNPRINRGCNVAKDFNNDNVKIVFLSKIRAAKGVELLIEAVGLLNRKFAHVSVTLDLYGLVDPSFKPTFLELIRENRSVFYKGISEADQVQTTIAGYDIFVLPSLLPEGVPGAVIEAMFTGIPIIVSDFSSARDIINNDVDGIIVPQNDLTALVLAIERLILDPKKRRDLSLAVSKRAKDFDYNTMMSFFSENLKENHFN